MHLERWLTLMTSLGLGANQDTYNALVEAYSEKHRRYHTGVHIDAVLAHFDRVIELAHDSVAVETALWFHDAVYKPFSARNELDSAEWAVKFLSTNGVSVNLAQRVHRLVMATIHSAEVDSNDAQLVVDIDLTILGARPSVYHQFEKDVRYEYKYVPYFLYRKKRKEILGGFLERERIYGNDFFYSSLEQTARANLINAIETL